MWRNYLLTAWRSLRRSPLYTVITVGGLALGLACCVLLILFLENEWTFDRFHEGHDRTYRVVRSVATPSGDTERKGTSPVPLGPAMAASEPAVEAATRIGTATGSTVRVDDETFEVDAMYADSSFARVFTFPTQTGRLSDVLARPDAAAITAGTAERLFGTVDVTGRSLTLVFEGSTAEVTVGAVMPAPPTNSSLQFDLLLPLSLYKKTYSSPRIWQFMTSSWDNGPVTTFVQLTGAKKASGVETRVQDLVDARLAETSDPATQSVSLQPLTDVHFAADVASPLPSRDPTSVYVLAVLAGLILLIACVNFTTLTLGQSIQRLHEVGVRKSIGAHAGQIRSQFWGEAVLVSAVSALLALGLAQMALPTFNRLAQESLTFALLDRPWRLVAIAGLVVGTGLVAGGYPSVLLARLSPSRILRGTSSLRLGQGATRALMVVQFALSIGFLSGAFVIDRQIDFMRGKALGYDADRLITFQASNVSNQPPNEDSISLGRSSLYSTFKSEALNASSIAGVTGTLQPVMARDGGGLQVGLSGPNGSAVSVNVNGVDSSFVRVMGIDVRAGRGTPTNSDPMGVVVNRALVEAMGWTSPIGKTLHPEGRLSAILDGAEVIGVVENFNYQTLHHPIEPLILISDERVGSHQMHVAVRLQPGQTADGLDAARSAWTAVTGGAPFRYEFVDARIAQQYAEEERWQSITAWASTFALLIACAGLFGLATLATQRRRREIGIRKALGASIGRILRLVSKDFLVLVGVAFVVAVPVAYGALQQWLQTFAYRIDTMSVWMGAAGLLTLLVAAAAVGVQAYRAARTNPADVIRAE